MAEVAVLRDRRAEVTRDVIRQAVIDLLADEHPASISVAAVAERAGLSARTIYRYYPNKQAMLDDVAEIQRRKVEAMSRSARALYSNPQQWLPVLWQTFSDDIVSVRAQQHSAAGADLRDRRLGQSRTGLAAELEEQHPDLDDEAVARLVDAVIAVTSSSMFLELHDRMGWDVREAAELSLWMVDSLRANATEVPR